MLFAENVDAAWAQYTGTAGLGVTGGVFVGLVTMYFWTKGKRRADRVEESAAEKQETANQIAAGQMLAEEYKKISDWQSGVYTRRMDELGKDILELRNAMKLLHAERNDCLKRTAEAEAKVVLQEARIKAQDAKITDLEGEVARLRAIVAKGSESALTAAVKAVAVETIAESKVAAS